MTGDDAAPRHVDGEVRLKHGYTNATSTDGRAVIKRYVGPDAAARQASEVTALVSLAHLLPVPPLVEVGNGVIRIGVLAGVPGQELLVDQPEAVLHSVGRMARRLPELSPSGVWDWSGSGVLVHGDFGPQNMLFDADTAAVTGVLDWELAHRGDPVEDLAWAEWIVRFHHADLTWALPALFDGFGSRPPWPQRQAAMLAKCTWAIDFVRRWRPTDETGPALWQARIDRTAAFHG